MENAVRKDITLGRDRQAWRRRAGRLSRVKDDSRGEWLSSRCKGRKSGRETCVERVKESEEEERGKPNMRREGWDLSRSPDPTPGPSPSPACGIRPRRQGQKSHLEPPKYPHSS